MGEAIYLIDGVKYKSDVPLTDAELEELSSPEIGASAPAKDSWRAEAVRKGLTDFVSPIVGAFKGAFAGTGQTGARQAAKETQESLMGMLGGTGAKPEGDWEKVQSTAIEAVSNPVSYLFPSTKLVEEAGPVLKAVGKVVENLFAGGGGEAGGIAGEYAGKKIGGETGAMVGRVGGALVGGAAGVASMGAIPRAGMLGKAGWDMAAPVVKKIIEKARGGQPIAEAEKMAAKHIENVFIAAAVNDPKFISVLDEAIAAQKKTGVKLPIGSVLSDNPVIDSYIRKLAADDENFRGQYMAQFDAAKAQLRRKSEILFGSPSQSDARLSGNKDVSAQSAVDRRKVAIERQAMRASKGLDEVDPAEFGSRVVRLTDDAEDAARAAANPAYTAAFKIGKERGVSLPEESVADIFGFVTESKAGDVFKTFPSIYGKVVGAFKPKTVEGSGLIDESGKLFSPATEQAFKSASLEDLDSLKREVNLQLRRTKTDSEIRLLGTLKDKVNEHINALDPVFVDAYKAADKNFLMKVGLPFNSETINQVGRAKFDENVIPLLTKNKSALQQFVDATGDQGKQLAEQAFISDLTKFAVKDGVIDPNKASAWMRRNSDALSLVPDVKKRVTDVAGDVNQLLNQKRALDGNFVKQAENRILKLEGKSAQEIVSELYRSPQFVEKFMGRHMAVDSSLGLKSAGGANADTLKAIRSFLLDDITSAKDPISVLADRSKAQVFNRVFGPTYSDKVKQLAIIADRITKNPSDVLIDLPKISQDIFTGTVGTSLPSTISLLVTNPVVSTPVAVSMLLNRFFNKQAGKLADQQMKDMLSDPEMAVSMFKAFRPKIDAAIIENTNKQLQSIAKKAGVNFVDMLLSDIKSGVSRSTGGMDGNEQSQQEEQEQ